MPEISFRVEWDIGFVQLLQRPGNKNPLLERVVSSADTVMSKAIFVSGRTGCFTKCMHLIPCCIYRFVLLNDVADCQIVAFRTFQ